MPIYTAAFDPVPADPGCFVNRDAERASLEAQIEARMSSGNRAARITVIGEKGVGKTILTRKVLWHLQERIPRQVQVEVEGRMIGLRAALKCLARGLVQQGFALLAEEPVLAKEKQGAPRLDLALRQLGLLATLETISETDTQSVARQLGLQVGGEGKLDGIFGALGLKGLFSWQETRQTGLATQRTRQVTDELLRESIMEVLFGFWIREVPVIVFFNDLDQLVSRENPDALRDKLAFLVGIDCCIQIVNLRPEVMFDDLRRESVIFEVGRMSSVDLLRLYTERCKLELRPEQNARILAPDVRALAGSLAVSGNPFAFLTWLDHALRVLEEPLSPWPGRTPG